MKKAKFLVSFFIVLVIVLSLSLPSAWGIDLYDEEFTFIQGCIIDFPQQSTTSYSTGYTKFVQKVMHSYNSTTRGLINSGGGIDGAFGDCTKSAVKSFQLAKGLQNDGVVGINTWTAIAMGLYRQSNQYGKMTYTNLYNNATSSIRVLNYVLIDGYLYHFYTYNENDSRFSDWFHYETLY